MSGKTNALEIAFLKLLFNATPLANIWDNAASSPIANLYISLHTADPTDAGLQTSNEVTYGSYARIAVARTGSGWIVSSTDGSVSPAATITFAAPTSGSGTVTHVGVGRDASGAGYLFYAGTVTPNIVLTVGVQPQLTTASVVTED